MWNYEKCVDASNTIIYISDVKMWSILKHTTLCSGRKQSGVRGHTMRKSKGPAPKQSLTEKFPVTFLHFSFLKTGTFFFWLTFHDLHTLPSTSASWFKKPVRLILLQELVRWQDCYTLHGAHSRTLQCKSYQKNMLHCISFTKRKLNF